MRLYGRNTVKPYDFTTVKPHTDMKKIGIISDTHSYWDDKYLHYFEPCDEIWHAGDIGSMEVAERLAEFRMFRDVLMKHIGGYPGNYDASIRASIYASPPRLFISGHSHILKVKYDKTLNLLHINPGAAGLQGWHRERTIVRLTVDGNDFKDLEVVTLNDPRRCGDTIF